MHVFRSCGKLAVDGTGVREQKIWPSWVPNPKVGAAFRAEFTMCRACHGLPGLRIFDLSLIDRQMVFTSDLKRIGISRNVNAEAAATRCLATNRAVAMVKRIRMVRLHGKLNRLAVTGPFEFHETYPSWFIFCIKAFLTVSANRGSA